MLAIAYSISIVENCESKQMYFSLKSPEGGTKLLLAEQYLPRVTQEIPDAKRNYKGISLNENLHESYNI